MERQMELDTAVLPSLLVVGSSTHIDPNRRLKGEYC